MISVIQVFKKKASFDKSCYSVGTRLSFKKWPISFYSQNGYFKDETLTLPNHLKEEHQLVHSSAIIIMDTLSHNNLLTDVTSPYQFCNLNNKRILEIFTLHQIKPDQFELNTRFEKFGHMSTTPKRSDHRVGILNPGDSICFRTNDRWDFSYTSRRNRTYVEYDYIFQNLGIAKSIIFKTPAAMGQKKLTHFKNSKLVDERRRLY